MWIFLNDAFLSIVAHTERPDHLHVRARLLGDIERTFPSAEVTETPGADYRYRTDIPRDEVARVLADRAASIDYPNFKASIGAGERERRRASHDVWGVMKRMQDRA